MAMPTRKITLTEHDESVIDRLVESGSFLDTSDVLREGLRLIELCQSNDEFRLQAMRAAVQVGFDDIEAGRYKDFESFEDLEQYLRKRSDEVIKKAAARRNDDKVSK
jgi:antitoxin ParD1/3/4